SSDLGLRVRRTPVGRTFTLRARTLALALEGPFGLRTRLALHVAGALGHLGTPRACRLAILARLVAARALAGAQRLGGFLLQALQALAELLLHFRQRHMLSSEVRNTGPKRTRLRRLTTTPWDSHRRRTSRLRPSITTTWNQRFRPSPPGASWMSVNLAGPSSSITPFFRVSIISSVT